MEKIKNFYLRNKLPILQNVVIFGLLWSALSGFMFSGISLTISIACGLIIAIVGFILSLKN